MTTLGIDVSAAQGHIDWIRVARWRSKFGDAVEFAIVKATEGNGAVPDDCDAQCRANSVGASTVGLLVGWYHFAHPDTVHVNDPVDEAEHFVHVARVNGYVPSMHLLALDIEEARRIHKGQDFHDWVRAFLAHVTAITGRWCWIYTGGPFFDGEEAGVADPTLAEFPLWLAAYVPAQSRDRFVPRPWHDVGCLLWQRSGDESASDCSILRVDGIATNVDRDEYDGTIEQLRELVASLGVTSSPTMPSPPPDPPDPRTVNQVGGSTLNDNCHSIMFELSHDDDEPDTPAETPTARRTSSSQRLPALKIQNDTEPER